MEKITLDGITLFFAARDREAAGWMGAAAGEALRLVRERWGLAPRGGFQVHAMTSWAGFLVATAPWSLRPWLVLSLPLWVSRVAKTWRMAGGWTQRFGSRVAVGVKPPRLLLAADRSLGERLFLSEPDVQGKVRQITWHETVHACSLHHKLPAWLNEGLAMVAVDRLAGKPTVRPETLSWLLESAKTKPGRRYPSHYRGNGEAFLSLYARGYWRVRFLEETRSGLLKELLAVRRSPDEWLPPFAEACGLPDGSGWAEVDLAVVRHFEQ